MLPALRSFAPRVIFVAMGFDALAGDPYAHQKLSPPWFGWLAVRLTLLFFRIILVPGFAFLDCCVVLRLKDAREMCVGPCVVTGARADVID